MARIAIRDIEVELPAGRLTNAELDEQHPDWRVNLAADKVGVESRPIARPDETAYDLALAACRRMLERNAGLAEEVDTLIFCTQTPDFVMPPNSCILHSDLGLRHDVMALDFNHACSGYIYGLSLLEGLFASGTSRSALLVTADTYSKLVSPGDRATRLLFGDGAAVTWLAPSETSGLVGVKCSTFGRGHQNFMVQAGGFRRPRTPATAETRVDKSGNVRSDDNICMNGAAILGFVSSLVPANIRALLETHGLTLDDIDLVVFHQASKVALQALSRKLRIPEEKQFIHMEQTGNLVSASIPVAIKDAESLGRMSRGDKILLIGFGVGLSYGSAVVDY